ncbi:MAG: dockerin type I domain-containing protein, partial [Thermoplasmatota archaeon]
VPDWTLSFDAPEGAGYYRFKSLAYDCVGAREEDGGPESSVHLDLPVYLSVGQPFYGSWISPITPLNITGRPDANPLFYRLFNNGSWSPAPGSGQGRDQSFHLYAGNFTLAQHVCTDGNVTIEYYGQNTSLYVFTCHLDGSPPKVNFSLPLSYLHCRSVTAAASAVDTGSGVREVLFSYRYSVDNQSWGNWTAAATIAVAPYEHVFSLPTGYYVLEAEAVDYLEQSSPALSPVVRIFNPDVNGDGRVNILDLMRVARHWGEAAGEDTHVVDLNGDRVIGMPDLVLAGRYWTG